MSKKITKQILDRAAIRDKKLRRYLLGMSLDELKKQLINSDLRYSLNQYLEILDSNKGIIIIPRDFVVIQ